MKRLITVIYSIMALLLMQVAFVAASSAVMVTLSWEQPNDDRVTGYNIYYSTVNGDWAEPAFSLPDNQTSVDIDDLEPGTQYYFTATSFDADSNESDFSDPVGFKTAQPSSQELFADITATPPFTKSEPSVVGTLNELPNAADIIDCGWRINGLEAAKGNIVTFQAYTYFDQGTAPVSVFIVNSNTGEFISRERIVLLSGSGQISTELPIIQNCDNASLVIVCGHKLGYYEFSDIHMSVDTPAVTPVGDLYLADLVPSNSGNVCAAQVEWEEAAAADEYIIRIATNRKSIENPNVFYLYQETTIPADQANYAIEIPPALYDGIHFSVSAINSNEESAPQIISYLPGNILDHQDDALPTLIPQISVASNDYLEVRHGYSTRRVVPPTESGPASTEERMDIDNNGYAGYIEEYRFVRSQYGKYLLLE